MSGRLLDHMSREPVPWPVLKRVRRTGCDAGMVRSMRALVWSLTGSQVQGVLWGQR